MFGNLSGMMSKLKQAQQEIEETKKRLSTIFIDESGADNRIKVTVTANREVKAITIDKSLLEDAEELEDFLILTLNKALSKANTINEQEMAVAAKKGMPNIPGLESLM